MLRCYCRSLHGKKKRLYFPSPIWVFLLCLHSWLRADWPESSEEGRADLGNFLLRLPMLLLSVLQFWHGRPSPLSGTARPLWFQLFEQLYSLLDCWIIFFFPETPRHSRENTIGPESHSTDWLLVTNFDLFWKHSLHFFWLIRALRVARQMALKFLHYARHR